MENFKQIVVIAKELVAQSEKLEAKYTKAESKRVRATIGELKKLATSARADLVQKDKE